MMQNHIRKNNQTEPFYMTPKALMLNPQYRSLSGDAKWLYTMLCDRACLSEKNNWLDDNGQVYIYYTVKEIQKQMPYGDRKIGLLFRELENVALIRRKRQGLCKPMMIYPLPCAAVENEDSAPVEKQSHARKSTVRTVENRTSGYAEIDSQDSRKSTPNNTNKSQTDMNQTETASDGFDAMRSRVREQIEYGILKETVENGTLDEMVTLITDTLIGTSSHIRVGGSQLSRQNVCKRLRTLNSSHIEYVAQLLKENTTAVRNIRAYLLTALYNAPTTMEHYYEAKVHHDMPWLNRSQKSDVRG